MKAYKCLVYCEGPAVGLRHPADGVNKQRNA
jgi:hypothetical protein